MLLPINFLTVLDWIFVSLLVVFYLYRRSTRISLDKVPGPRSNSFIYGNLPELLNSQVGQTDFRWLAEYGRVVKVTAPLGEHMLLVSDPKALHHIFQATGYQYARHRTRQLMIQIMTGHGLTVVDDQNHRRQRKLMQPSFGASESRSLLPIFSSCALKLTGKWVDLLNASAEESIVLDLPVWVSRATLDAIGLAAFDYEFGALDNADNELSVAYRNFFKDVFGMPSKNNILAISIFKHVPKTLVQWFFRNAKSPRLQRLRSLGRLTRATAKKLFKEKSEALLNGHSRKDVMSSIVKANVSENPKSRLNEDEMYSLMQDFILAGHETTANSLGWTTMELSKHPEMQSKLRQEIWATERKIQARGETEFTAQDFESMPYLTSVVKEILRLHPVASVVYREASIDDVLPLSKPIISTTGQVLHELPIPKGTKIAASIAAYNRIPDIFGEDAHTFNPDRWSKADEMKQGTFIGVYANLFTFSGGNRSCIGWRFAVLELQAFLVNIIGNFELSLAVPAEKIRREACAVMIPTIEGEVEKGCQLPIRIKVATRDE